MSNPTTPNEVPSSTPEWLIQEITYFLVDPPPDPIGLATLIHNRFQQSLGGKEPIKERNYILDESADDWEKGRNALRTEITNAWNAPSEPKEK